MRHLPPIGCLFLGCLLAVTTLGADEVTCSGDRGFSTTANETPGESELDRLVSMESLPNTPGARLVVSVFYEMFNGSSQEERCAPQTRLAKYQHAIHEFLAGLPNVEYSIQAERLHRLRVLRKGDWVCFTDVGCYPEGEILIIDSVPKDTADDLCKLLLSNGFYCQLWNNPSMVADGAG